MSTNRSVFVVMPFSSTASCSQEQWTEIYENVFSPAFADHSYSCERAMPSVGNLSGSIIHKLRTSPIVLADLTDKNPNVFYELGVRHSLRRGTITVIQKGHGVPSDLLGYWYLEYGIRPGEVNQFKKDIGLLLSKMAENPLKSDSPVSDYLDREQINITLHEHRDTLKKLTALLTEATGNQLALEGLIPSSASLQVSISLDCMRLLLTTLYVDPGPKTLSLAYELSHKLRTIENGRFDDPLLSKTREELGEFLLAISDLRTKVLRDQFEEPTPISTMVWEKARAGKEDILSVNMSCACSSLFITEGHRHVPDFYRWATLYEELMQSHKSPLASMKGRDANYRRRRLAGRTETTRKADTRSKRASKDAKRPRGSTY